MSEPPPKYDVDVPQEGVRLHGPIDEKFQTAWDRNNAIYADTLARADDSLAAWPLPYKLALAIVLALPSLAAALFIGQISAWAGVLSFLVCFAALAAMASLLSFTVVLMKHRFAKSESRSERFVLAIILTVFCLVALLTAFLMAGWSR